MGNITLIDLLASAVIAGFLLLMLHHSNERMNETLFTSGNDLVVQENLVNLVNILQTDLRKIGYCKDQIKIPDVSKALLSADAHGVTFLTDVDDDGVVDTVQYYTGSVSGLVSTPNPRDMMLFRRVNGDPIGMSIGLTKFDFKYFDVNDAVVPQPVLSTDDVHSLQIDIQLESTFPYDNTYAYNAWRQLRIKTRNIRER
jgi:hypothetical protein